MPRLIRCLIFCFFLSSALFCTSHQAKALNLCGVLCSCTITTGSINFAGYDPTNGQAVTATGTITTSCQLLSGLTSLAVPYTLGLDKGLSGSFAPRKMMGPSSAGLGYNLYTDALMTNVWEDIGNVSQTVSGTITVTTVGLNVTQMQTVYGQIPASQNVKLGAYTDTITATLSF